MAYGFSDSSYGQPVNLVGVDGVASATGVLLITGTVDYDGVVDRSCGREKFIDQPLTHAKMRKIAWGDL